MPQRVRPEYVPLLRVQSLPGACFRYLSLAAAVAAACLAGCSRQYYRQDADQEALQLIREKEAYGYEVPQVNVYPDPRARIYDPYDPDHPPMPPDDPDSHQIMHCVYGIKGHKHWHDDGDITELENPNWRQYLEQFMERDKTGRYVMQLQDAVQLALINSDDYQSSLEELYLSALDVAFERFRFDVQFFGGNSTTFTHTGSEFRNRGIESRGPGRSSSQLTTRTFLDRGSTRTSGARAGLQKLLPAGGQFLVDFANTFVWQFVGPNRNTFAGSEIGFTFMQPLLRSAGRDVVMERLTFAERTLLANLRQMERFRQGFLLDVAMGTGSVGGPRRRGGFFGGAGLTGFTGQGTGGFSGVGAGQNFGGAGRIGGGAGGAGGGAAAGFAGGVAGNVGGFYGLLQQAQQIRNREANLAAQLDNLGRIEALFDAGRIDSFQVDQFRQNVQTARSQYLSALNSYQRSLELFLMNTLGLPPNLPVRLDEAPIQPFQFIDPELSALQRQIDGFLNEVRSAQEPSAPTMQQWLQRVIGFTGQVQQRLDLVHRDFSHLDQVRDQRLKHLRTDQQRKAFLEQVAKLRASFKMLQQRFQAARKGAEQVGQQLQAGQQATARENIVTVTESLADLLTDMTLVQAGVRLESVDLEPVHLDPETAFQIALANRQDIKNQRAAVVDQWRLIAFNANDLESDLDVVISGDLGTLDRNIAKFRDQTGSLSVALRFDAPLTRLGERNVYRQSLIDYQRRRRDYIRFLDREHQNIINLLRQIDQFEQEMELRRDAMRIAIRTVDQTQEKLREPPRAEAPAAGLGPTAVRDLLGALSDLLSTQNAVLATYLNYQALRMVLYRDLGIIRFDPRGIWIDEPLEEALRGVPVEQPYVPPACPFGHPAVPPPQNCGQCVLAAAQATSPPDNADPSDADGPGPQPAIQAVDGWRPARKPHPGPRLLPIPSDPKP